MDIFKAAIAGNLSISPKLFVNTIELQNNKLNNLFLLEVAFIYIISFYQYQKVYLDCLKKQKHIKVCF